MADVKWIKIVTDIFDDEKMILIERMPKADSIIIIWFKLLCMAGKQNNGGVFRLNDKIAYTDEMLASVFRRPLNTVRLALKTFETYGMIEIVDNVVTIPNWEKHQSLEGLGRKKELTRKRVEAYREKQKLNAISDNRCNVYGCVTDITSNAYGNVDSNVTDITNGVTVTHTERDIERDIDVDIEEKKCVKKRKTASRFAPPTLDEVNDYCSERQNNVDAQRFVDYYTANGWKVGRSDMRDWKAAVRTWERSNGGKPNSPKQQSGTNNPFLDLAHDEGVL